jgi:hypothetical protein
MDWSVSGCSDARCFIHANPSSSTVNDVDLFIGPLNQQSNCEEEEDDDVDNENQCNQSLFISVGGCDNGELFIEAPTEEEEDNEHEISQSLNIT